jgi:hypothetical protein
MLAAALAVSAVVTSAAPAAAIPATPSPVTGWIVVEAHTDITSDDKPAIATCPAGKKVIGAGASEAGAAGQIRVTALRLYPDYVYAYGVEDQDGTDWAWSLSVNAICADPPPGLEIKYATGRIDHAVGMGVDVDCPLGKTVIGTGYSMNYGQGQIGLSRLLVSGSHLAVTGQADPDRYPFSWSASAYAVCAYPPAGYQVVEKDYWGEAPGRLNLTAVCPDGTRVLGGGATLATDSAVIDDLTPTMHEFQLSTYATTTDPTLSNWHVQAICAQADR